MITFSSAFHPSCFLVSEAVAPDANLSLCFTADTGFPMRSTSLLSGRFPRDLNSHSVIFPMGFSPLLLWATVHIWTWTYQECFPDFCLLMDISPTSKPVAPPGPMTPLVSSLSRSHYGLLQVRTPLGGGICLPTLFFTPSGGPFPLPLRLGPGGETPYQATRMLFVHF